MTKAYLIEGTMRTGGNGGYTNVVGVAFFPDDAMRTLKVNMLENMGFLPPKRSQLSFEEARTNGGAPTEPTLYFYDRSAANRIVSIAKLNTDGTRATTTSIVLDKRTGEHPRYVIPAISGCGAIRVGLADASNGPDMKDFRRHAQFPPGRKVAYAR